MRTKGFLNAHDTQIGPHRGAYSSHGASRCRPERHIAQADAHKGVTDILTKYLWPEWALALTRLCAAFGITTDEHDAEIGG